MATIGYDVTKPLPLKAAMAASKFQEALADCKRIASLALATVIAAGGDAGTDAAWAVLEGPDNEWGIVAGNTPGVQARAWFTAVDTLNNLSDEAKDALEKLDKGA